jgi:hypothetical protein
MHIHYFGVIARGGLSIFFSKVFWAVTLTL